MRSSPYAPPPPLPSLAATSSSPSPPPPTPGPAAIPTSASSTPLIHPHPLLLRPQLPNLRRRPHGAARRNLRDTSKFPYTFPKGLRSAIRVVKEAVDRMDEAAGVRWFVFGDNDIVFFVDNLIKTLSKYDDDRWFYVGSNSESYEQNVKHSFDMAFGGGRFAVSHSLARVLDSCLMRYAHLYGSDDRVFSCLVELGVGLTHEPGFHQVYEGNELLPDLFSLQRTFLPWRKDANVDSHFMFNLRDYPRNPCKKPIVFFLESVLSDNGTVQSNYVKHVVGNCDRANAVKNLEQIGVFSEKLELDVEEMKSPRCQRCDIFPTYNDSMVLKIRQCKVNELMMASDKRCNRQNLRSSSHFWYCPWNCCMIIGNTLLLAGAFKTFFKFNLMSLLK